MKNVLIPLPVALTGAIQNEAQFSISFDLNLQGAHAHVRALWAMSVFLCRETWGDVSGRL